MKIKYLAFAAAAFLLASCSNDDDFVPQDNLKDTPITVTAGVAELTTRAGHDNSNLPETFYLSINQENDLYDYTNVEMQLVNGTWKTYEEDGETEKKLLWGSSKENVSVTAATFSLAGAQDLAVQTNQSTPDAVKASDHLYMEATEQGYAAVEETENTAGKAAGAVNVTFNHIMSKVILTITLGDEFNSQTNPINNVTFIGTVATNSYTAGTGWATIAGNVTATDIIACQETYTPISNTVTNASAKYEVILVPQTVTANGFTVMFSVGDREFKWTSNDAVTLESGYKYALNITVGKDKVSGASFSASPWNTGEGDSNKLSGETE